MEIQSICTVGSWAPKIRWSSVPRLRYVGDTALFEKKLHSLSPQRIPAASIFWQFLSQAFLSCSFCPLRSLEFWAVLLSTFFRKLAQEGI